MPADLNEKQWKDVGLKLMTIDNDVQWALGDWWTPVRRAYGQRAAAAKAKKLPYEFGYLMNLGAVARSVPTSLRNEALSWSQHKTVAPLDRDE